MKKQRKNKNCGEVIFLDEKKKTQIERLCQCDRIITAVTTA